MNQKLDRTTMISSKREVPSTFERSSSRAAEGPLLNSTWACPAASRCGRIIPEGTIANTSLTRDSTDSDSVPIDFHKDKGFVEAKSADESSFTKPSPIAIQNGSKM